MLSLLLTVLVVLLVLGLLDLLVRRAPMIDTEIKTYLRFVLLAGAVIYLILVLTGHAGHRIDLIN